MQADVSAVITTYNRASIVTDAIRSVFAQTLPVKELIVVDDGSQDNTQVTVTQLFASAPIPCRYIQKENGGMATALNRGIDEASGEWVAFLDDDDLWSEDHLERCLSIAAARPDWGCICGLREEKGSLQTPPPKMLKRYIEDDVDGPVLLKKKEPLVGPFFTPVVGTSVTRRVLFDQIRFAPEAGARLDIHFFWRLSQIANIGLDLRAHGSGRQFRVSYLSTDDGASQQEKDRIVLKRNSDEISMLRFLLKKEHLAMRNEFPEILHQTLIGRSFLLRGMGRFFEAICSLKDCIGVCSVTSIGKEFVLSLARVRPSRPKRSSSS